MLTLLFTLAQATAPALHPPVLCQPGVTCWISSRPDVDPGPGIRDHTGGSHTYEGHKGTDFAVAGRAQGAATWVQAPVAGKVVRTRDGEDDGVAIAGGTVSPDRMCGNAVVIGVDDGWELQLCHLLKGSVQVKPGDEVAIGSRLGRIGLSGSTDHPHVHLTVRKGRRVVDPFSGKAIDDGTPIAPKPLWLIEPIAPGDQDALAWIGFRPGPKDEGPDWPVETGLSEVPSDSQSLVLEVFLWHPEKGDVVQTRIVRPDGTRTTGTVTQPRDRPRQVWRVEKTWLAGERPAGTWNATVTWRRGDRTRTLQTSTVLR